MDVSTHLREALQDRYRIEREIGAGGMATVYLAEDIRHRRRVALKVLRPELAAVLGPERFLSEINVTANLQHPHLLPLFDSGEVDGVLFYVMPYIEGESLRHRLERERQLPVDDAVRIALSIASALDYAHRHGVIHRDLKPENILLHDGQPLVADFGIALAVSNAGGARVTQTGLSLGTPQYMSPEQATGDRAVDGRSDIYSLSAILYEMLAGEPPHTAGTTQGVIAKLLTEKPPSVRAYRESVPAHVDATIQAGLAKLAADRFATAADFAAALSGERAITPRIVAAPATVEDAKPLRSRRRTNQVVLAAAGVLVLLSAGAMALRQPGLTDRTAVLVTIADGDSATYLSRTGVSIALSKQGTHLAYTGMFGNANGILVQSLSEPDAEFVRGSNGGVSPIFSPDGQWLAFMSGNSIYKVPLAGGQPVLLTDSGGVTLDWGDGYVYFQHNASRGILRVPQDGGISETVAVPDSTRGHQLYRWLSLLPGGRHAIVTLYRRGETVTDAELGVMRLRDGSVRELDLAGTSGRYTRSGHIVFARSDGSVYAAPFSLRRRRVTGELVRVAEVVNIGSGGKADIAVSENGSFAYGQGSDGGRDVILHNGTVARTLSLDGAEFVTPRVSPDGRRLAIGINTADGGDTWIMEAASGSVTRITSGTGDNFGAWTPDGQRVAMINSLADSIITIQRWDGAGESVQIDMPRDLSELSFGTTNRLVAVRTSGAGGARARDIFVMHADSPGVPRPFLATPSDERSPEFSPDGTLLAYASDETGSLEVYMRPYPGPGGRVRVSERGGVEPMWSRDGRTLYYRAEAHMMAATIARSPELAVTARAELFPDTYVRSTTRNYDILPTGEFVMIGNRARSESSLRVIVNWDRRLAR